jgi:hypothetical protein
MAARLYYNLTPIAPLSELVETVTLFVGNL